MKKGIEMDLGFIGLSTYYLTKDGKEVLRRYLDSAASTLMMEEVFKAAREFLKYYANTHSNIHNSAKITTEAMSWAHEKVLNFVHADKKDYVSLFYGSGVTSCINRLAKSLKELRPNKSIVIVSSMEHHSNDLPHRKFAGKVIRVPLITSQNGIGSICIKSLKKILTNYQGKVNYIAVTGVSNVTGIINPIYEIAKLAHEHQAYIIVDGAQMAPHVPVYLNNDKDSAYSIDAFTFSGHKIYAPGSPGVIVIKKELLEKLAPYEIGGGVVVDVQPDSYIITDQFPDREQPGTPPILGAIMVATALEVLDMIGMDKIFEKERYLISKTIQELKKIKEVIIYGDTDLNLFPRVGCLGFNLKGIDHGLVAAVLNDYHNIEVRNGCFCAHPYVRELISQTLWDIDITGMNNEEAEFHVNLKRGMIRASFGLYTTEEDIFCLVNGLKDILTNIEKYKTLYMSKKDGNYIHISEVKNTKEFFLKDIIHDMRRERINT